MRIYILIIALFVLPGCTDQNNDLIEYINKVKVRKTMMVEKVPDVVTFIPLQYSEHGERNPFADPRKEAMQITVSTPKNCLQPNFSRSKGPLEKFSLDSLDMHGTLGRDKHLWGLVRSSSGEIFRVASGDYIGPNHGKVRRITKTYIELSEMMLTGKGCWQVRKTKLPLSNQESS